MRNGHLAVLALFILALSLGACNKQKSCRCAVKGTPNVRIIKIEKGECDQIRSYGYHDVVDTLQVEELLCTDYEFTIDSIFNE